MSVIKVMITEGDRQLGEIHFEKLNSYESGVDEYLAKVAVDSGPELHCFTRTFFHRQRHNVLGMIESLIFELGVSETTMQGPYEKRSVKPGELGRMFDA